MMYLGYMACNQRTVELLEPGKVPEKNWAISYQPSDTMGMMKNVPNTNGMDFYNTALGGSRFPQLETYINLFSYPV